MSGVGAPKEEGLLCGWRQHLPRIHDFQSANPSAIPEPCFSTLFSPSTDLLSRSQALCKSRIRYFSKCNLPCRGWVALGMTHDPLYTRLYGHVCQMQLLRLCHVSGCKYSHYGLFQATSLTQLSAEQRDKQVCGWLL